MRDSASLEKFKTENCENIFKFCVFILKGNWGKSTLSKLRNRNYFTFLKIDSTIKTKQFRERFLQYYVVLYQVSSIPSAADVMSLGGEPAAGSTFLMLTQVGEPTMDTNSKSVNLEEFPVNWDMGHSMPNHYNLWKFVSKWTHNNCLLPTPNFSENDENCFMFLTCLCLFENSTQLFPFSLKWKHFRRNIDW